jgi:hypothetical protein
MPLTSLEQAQLDRLKDLLRFQDMAQDEVDYLAHVADIEDPETDGLACSFDEETD